MKRIALALLLALPLPAWAGEVMRIEAAGSVAEAVDRLEAAVAAAGATVFARIDHGAGAASVGTPVGASELLIFGNPALGTPAIAADPLAGLHLPLRVLAYEGAEGTTWLAYEDPADMFEGLAIGADAEVIGKMRGALGKLTAAAAAG